MTGTQPIHGSIIGTIVVLWSLSVVVSQEFAVTGKSVKTSTETAEGIDVTTGINNVESDDGVLFTFCPPLGLEDVIGLLDTEMLEEGTTGSTPSTVVEFCDPVKNDEGMN
jgi:hypothetical protein